MRLYRCHSCNSLVFRLDVHRWRWIPRRWRWAMVTRRIRRRSRRLMRSADRRQVARMGRPSLLHDIDWSSGISIDRIRRRIAELEAARKDAL